MARQKQKQKQSQKVIVNIGTQVTKRKKRKIGARKAPSSQVNIQPIVLPQTDYSPLILAMMEQNKSQNQTRNINVPSLGENNTTPLSLSSRLPASVMAGKAAEERRPGPTADSFQPLPSQADERFSMSREDRDAPGGVTTFTAFGSLSESDVTVRPPDPVFTQRLVKSEPSGPSPLGGPPPFAESRPKVGRPPKDITIGVKEGDPEPEPEPEPKEKAKKKQLSKMSVNELKEEAKRLGFVLKTKKNKKKMAAEIREFKKEKEK